MPKPTESDGGTMTTHDTCEFNEQLSIFLSPKDAAIFEEASKLFGKSTKSLYEALDGLEKSMKLLREMDLGDQWAEAAKHREDKWRRHARGCDDFSVMCDMARTCVTEGAKECERRLLESQRNLQRLNNGLGGEQ
jgi:hypothetical protein